MKRYICLIVFLVGLAACKKEAVSTRGKDPYQEPVLPAILINKNGINPASAHVGEEVEISGKGFQQHKDQLSILFNGEKAQIIALTDTTIRVKVPVGAATGNVAAQVDQQYFFGPFFRVIGVFEMDTLFPSKTGANNNINDVLPVENGKYLIVGDFTNYNNNPSASGVNRVTRINHDGTLDNDFNTGEKNGTNTSVYAAAMLPGAGNRYVVAGAFNNYEGVSNVNSIAILNNNGTLARDKIFTPSGRDVAVSILKGGVSGQATAVLPQEDGRIILTGYFRFYVQPNYQLTNSVGLDSIHLDSIQVNGIIRLMADGGIDSTYNYDLSKHMGKEGPNGYINRSILLPDGKLLIVGSFTKYNGQPANRIARLNIDGSLDPTFTPGVGPDQSINTLERQADGKLILVGSFNSYGGLQAPGIVRINENGVVDPSFNAGNGSNGYVYSLGIMPGGEVIVGGIFSQFSNARCNNIIVLNPDGSVHPAFNSGGGITLSDYAVSGAINKVIQQKDEKGILIVGSFTKFDFRTANRIVRITYP
ncbi:IPT/TIG domain-containing protein [Chitinophaga sp. 30R24]|uniref:IPT/TIG domain-containing protein n=1 Tax=Chitinophaga sp. 30R24 TaxID=3248838 RepID=UPI003B8EFEF4